MAAVVPEAGSHRVAIEAPAVLARFIAPKGSIAVDGVSLTVNEVEGARFRGEHHPAYLVRDHARGLCSRAARCISKSTCWRATSPALPRCHEDTRCSPTICPAPADLVEEARAGRMFVLVDDEDRENEGDLVIPAQFATPDAINFMARHARGLICLAMTRQRVEQLGLTLMSQSNGTRHQTAFTVSIEARDGVTTGISAADRARTIAVAINPEATRDSIVTPGHVFPLVARDGGTLVRAGHTEAAVDIARLAGLTPAGVICEIMNDDGTMARLPDLVAFAQRHNLKLGTHRGPDRLSAADRAPGAPRAGRAAAPRGRRRLGADRLCDHARPRRAPRAEQGRPPRPAAAAGADACGGHRQRHGGRARALDVARRDADDRGTRAGGPWC